MIYFIQRGEDGPIKIGFSTDPVLRLKSLQTSSAEPLTLCGFMPGGTDIERVLHQRFDEGRLEGEWFRADTPGLGQEISRSGHGEYLIDALGEADEKVKSWQKRRDELVEEILAFCGTTARPQEAKV